MHKAVQKAISLKHQKIQSKIDRCKKNKKFLDDLNKNAVKYEDIWKTKILRIEERYEEVIQLCGKTLDSVEKNACPLDAGCKVTDLDNSQLSKVVLIPCNLFPFEVYDEFVSMHNMQLGNKTLVRYQLPVVVIVFNNGGDHRHPEEIDGPHKDDPAPTDFVPNAGYHALIQAFGGKGYLVGTRDELKSALSESFSARKPDVVNVVIDPYAGSESGRMQYKN
ncbi:hypothetical protein JHK86_016494 [Glycine max]|nr:hypothetical protein JHK86_016494 [Glycine max]